VISAVEQKSPSSSSSGEARIRSRPVAYLKKGFGMKCPAFQIAGKTCPYSLKEFGMFIHVIQTTETVA
jgi:hypothetical protein